MAQLFDYRGRDPIDQLSVPKYGIDEHILKARNACLISCFKTGQGAIFTNDFRDYQKEVWGAPAPTVSELWPVPS